MNSVLRWAAARFRGRKTAAILITWTLTCGGVAMGQSTADARPEMALFVAHAEKQEGGQEVIPTGQSKSGYVSATPEAEFRELLKVVLLGVKEIRPNAAGQVEFVDGEAELLINFFEEDGKKIAALREKSGGAALFLRVQCEGVTRYVAAEFAPVTDDTLFLTGTPREKAEIAAILRRAVKKD